MFGSFVHDAELRHKLKGLMPAGVKVGAIWLCSGTILGLAARRMGRYASVRIPKRIFDRAPDRKMREGAEELLQRLDKPRSRKTGE